MEQEIYQKEYSIEKILSEAWQIFKENFRLISIIVLIIFIPLNIVYLSLGETNETMMGAVGFVETETSTDIIFGILDGLIGIIVTMAIIYATKARRENREVDYRECFQGALSRWWPAVGTNILLTIFLIGLFILLIIPGIIYSVYWTFALCAVVLCNKSGIDALNYSKAIVQGRWWTIWWYSLALGIISIVIYVGIDLFSLLFPSHPLSLLISNLMINIVSAFFIVVTTVFFLNFDSTREEIPLKDIGYNETI